MQNKILFKDGKEFMLISFNVNDEIFGDGVPESIFLEVAIDENDSVTTVESLFGSVESGIQSIIYENGEVDHQIPIIVNGVEYNFSFISPDDYYVHNNRYYMGSNSEGKAVYAKSIIGMTLLTEAEGEVYTTKLRENKIAYLSDLCQDKIEDGFEITLSDGVKRKFSYKQVDRENISEMFNAVVFGATAYPYHEDGGACQTFSATDIVIIYSAMVQNKTHHTTYFNQLKQMLKDSKSAVWIASVNYGQELTGKYLDAYNANMVEAANQLKNILAKIKG